MQLGGLVVNLFNDTIRTLEKSLDYSTAKNRAISENIANVDTPNYKMKDVVFKDVLNNNLSGSTTMKNTDPRHFSIDTDAGQSFQTSVRNQTMYNHNGNNVDVDKEMAELAKNQIYYQAIVDRLNGKFSSIQTVIRGGS